MSTQGVTITTTAAVVATQQRTDTIPAIVGDGTGTAGSGDLIAYDTPVTITSAAQATETFGVGSVSDFCTQFFARDTGSIVAVRYNDSTTANVGYLASGASNASRAAVVNRAVASLNNSAVDFDFVVIPAGGRPSGAGSYNPCANTDSGTETASNAVVSNLQSYCDSRQIIGFVDSYYDATASSRYASAITYKGNNQGSRLVVCFGRVTSDGVTLGSSAVIAAETARQDSLLGIQEPLLNDVVSGSISLSDSPSFSHYANVSTQSSSLKAVELFHIVYENGNYLIIDGHFQNPDNLLRFFGARRVVDFAEKVIARLTIAYKLIGSNRTGIRLSDGEEGINEALATFARQGFYEYAHITLSSDQPSESNAINFDLEMRVYTPIETVTYRSVVTPALGTA